MINKSIVIVDRLDTPVCFTTNEGAGFLIHFHNYKNTTV